MLPAAVDAGELRWPRFVLAGLDSVPARHDLQRLWPDRLVDAGTSDTAVGLHDVVGDKGPCIMCFLPARTEESAIVRVAVETGLTVERLGRGNEALLAEEIEQLTAEQQASSAPTWAGPSAA